MGEPAVQPTVVRKPYLERAKPQKTPDRREPMCKHKRFKVVGPKSVFGLEPNETGELCLTEGQAQALIEAGHLVPAEG